MIDRNALDPPPPSVSLYSSSHMLFCTAASWASSADGASAVASASTARAAVGGGGSGGGGGMAARARARLQQRARRACEGGARFVWEKEGERVGWASFFFFITDPPQPSPRPRSTPSPSRLGAPATKKGGLHRRKKKEKKNNSSTAKKEKCSLSYLSFSHLALSFSQSEWNQNTQTRENDDVRGTCENEECGRGGAQAGRAEPKKKWVKSKNKPNRVAQLPPSLRSLSPLPLKTA